MSEQQIFAKCAWRLIPFITLLYFINFVDRVNVGFAALTMNRDLGFSPSVFGFGAGVFFVGYALFQIPANALLVRFGARRWICGAPVSSGSKFLPVVVRSRSKFSASTFTDASPNRLSVAKIINWVTFRPEGASSTS